MQRDHSWKKTLDAGEDWGQEEKGATEDEAVGWHHCLNGHEFKQIPWDSEGQGSLVCRSPQGCKELDTTLQLNNNKQPSVSCFYFHLLHTLSLRSSFFSPLLPLPRRSHRLACFPTVILGGVLENKVARGALTQTCWLCDFQLHGNQEL